MFKLFKDLTRPPEPLSPRPSIVAESSQSSLPYTPRQGRGATPNPVSPDPAVLPTPAAIVEPKKVVEVEESDANARTVAELLKKLEGGGDVMHYVETLSQINLVPQTALAAGAFRRHRGFTTLIRVFGKGLRWKARGDGDGEEWEVREVQRMEGVRIGMETLGWALSDRENRAVFEGVGGYLGLLHIFRSLSASTADTVSSPSSSSRGACPDLDVRHAPDPKILAHIMSHVLNDNYSLLSVVTDSQSYAEEELREKLGELTIQRGAALPLLWAYLWGLDPSPTTETRKGKERDYHDVQEERLLCSGELEQSANSALLRTVVQVLLLAAQSSVINIFKIRRHLPRLDDFLMTRLYGYTRKRKYDVTFPARDDWCDDLPDDESDLLLWRRPSNELRTVYVALLRRLLEAGVEQRLVWRLFGLVKVSANSLAQRSAGTSGISTPLTSPRPDGMTQIDPTSKAKARKRPKPALQISTTIKSEDEERLDTEVLDLIRHCMKARWPAAFVFGGSGPAEGGLELRDMVKTWPSGQKGFNFSCWVYVTKLNRPITLLQASQANQTHPLFAVRILENSQIALISTIAKTASGTSGSTEGATAAEAAPDEIICAAPDALIPHHQWVHFAIGLRKPKGQEMGEARIFVNGTRVGAMRVPYPVPVPLPPAAPLHSRNGAANASPAEAIRLSLGRDLVDGPRSDVQHEAPGAQVGKQEENEWMLGRTLLLDEAVPEDIVLLMHHLGPRYIGNFQEALGKFLTYEGATSINVYLSGLALTAADKKMFTSPAHSILVRAIRQGPAFAEDSILLSLSAKDVDGDTCLNSAISQPYRAKQVRNGSLKIVGDVDTHTAMSLDESVACVGGGTVILKMIDLSSTTEELVVGLGLLRDMIRDCWSASEEMERIRGFEMLAAILRPKMPMMVDTACVKIILAMLGINMDKPTTATVHNSAAYRALGLEFELWSHASLGVVTLYLQHFEYLLSRSKHARYNVLRTFQKSAMVKKMLYALRSGYFDAEVVPVVVDTLRLALLARWSGEDAIKPVFSYLVSALCQGFGGSFSAILPNDPPPLQVSAAQILAMISELSSQPSRLQKLNKSLALHRLLIIFISSNSAFYVIVPCLEILQNCLITPGLEAFQRNFEAEGGFALLARTLGSCWRDDVQKLVFEMMLGPKTAEDGKESTTLACGQLVSTVLAALDWLLQASAEGGDEVRPALTGRTRSGTITSIRSVTLTQINTDVQGTISPMTSRLELLLTELIATHQSSHAFRRCMTGRKVEQMLPALADFAAVSSTSARPEVARNQRLLAAEWLQLIVDQGKISHTLLTQTKLIIEQLRSEPSSPKLSSGSFAMSPSSPRPATSYFGSSLTGRLSSTPPASPMLGSSLGGFGFSSMGGGGSNGPIPRRRPSTDAGPAGGMLGRSRSIVEMRTPLKRVLTGESVLEGGRDKNAAWKLIIIQTDSQSHSKMTLERKEHWQKLSEVEWPKLAAGLRTENGLWPDEVEHVDWRLDGSEGPLRMRNRLERVNAAPELGAQRTRHKLRDAIPSVDELSSAVSRMNAAPWEDPFALALGEAAPIEEEDSPLAPPAQPHQPAPAESDDRADDESYVEVEENKDDKMRRIAKTLQAGDVVEEAHNIVRIVGVDACPGLLILGKKNLYLVDGLVQTTEGEVIDAKDAPRDVLSIPGTLVDLGTNEQESHRWGYNEIVENNKRAFLFRDVALELYFSDKRNFLIVFKDKRERQGVVSKLTYKSDQTGAVARSVIGNFVLDQVARAIDRSEQQLEAMTRRWQHREISNFAYLMLLNQYANRTPNDVTQYPVFPWVLADYTSQKLDLDKVSTYRDLTLPMGALTPARKEAAVERYTATQGVGEQPFHYGTHYSSSMIVCGFLIRLSPFTEIFLALQGGNFDLADRLFSSIPRAWDSASADNRGDVRELIPEFYYSSAFMVNVNRHDFGRKQVTGDSVDNVILPPWALEDPLLFVHRHREALESDFVSRHLHSWIDLTFGYKQRDPGSYNCFHPLSYRGAVDLESISDDNEKAASTAIIHNFGQTPLQIFKTPHPHRIYGGRSELQMGQRFGIAEGWQLLIRSVIPISETLLPIYDVEPGFGDGAKPITMTPERLAVPGERSLSVQWGFGDGSLRVFYQETVVSLPRLVMLLEGISIQHAIFAAPTLLVTVSSQGVLTAWRLSCKNGGSRRGDVTMTREATLRGHTDTVTSITASSAWSLLVTGQEDGKAIVWDMNRLRYTRTLQTPHNEPLLYSAVNDSDGHIVLASSNHLYLFSLNGHPIASTTTDPDPLADFTFGLPESPAPQSQKVERFTGGITFLRRDFLRYGSLFVIGVEDELALFRCVPGERRFEDEEVKPWRLVEQGRLARSAECGGQCCMVKFIGETLYAAFEPAVKDSKARWKLYQWSLPEGDARHVPDSVSNVCMAAGCGRHFGLLDPKRHCGGCGGLFCGTHAVHVETFSMRYCELCRAQLADASSLGIINSRRDSAYPTSRRGSLAYSASAPGSRRPSVSNGTSRSASRPASRSASRPGSRSVSRVGSRRPSLSRGSTPTAGTSGFSTLSGAATPLAQGHGLGITTGSGTHSPLGGVARSREGTPSGP